MYAFELGDPSRTRVKVGVGIILQDAGGMILLERRRDNGLWSLPGGGIEAGETILQAALREMAEETGLTIRITGFVGVYSDPKDKRIVTYPDNGDLVHLVDIILTASPVSGTLRPSEESLEVKFCALDDLPGTLVPPAIRPRQDYASGKSAVLG